jgi:hypothetical protein
MGRMPERITVERSPWRGLRRAAHLLPEKSAAAFAKWAGKNIVLRRRVNSKSSLSGRSGACQATLWPLLDGGAVTARWLNVQVRLWEVEPADITGVTPK